MHFIRQFSEIGHNDIAVVGGKNASLGEMVSRLTELGIRVPDGFATTVEAFHYFLEYNQLRDRIYQRLADLDKRNLANLADTGSVIRRWINHADLPQDLADEICQAYDVLAERYGPKPDVAVRSSATAEDLPTASFAGQQETYLNICGKHDLLVTCKRVYASLFTDRAISYRVDQGFAHEQVGLSIGIQKMVRADSGASGVMFTLDPETGFRDVVSINAAFGLGENVVKGSVSPDEFVVFKPLLSQSKRPIIKRHLGEKAIKMIYARDTVAGFSTVNVAVTDSERCRFAISDDDVIELAQAAIKIEQHYSGLAGKPMPMDIEWAKDGLSGEIFILQARPETVHAQKTTDSYEICRLQERGRIITRGKGVGRKLASGRARIVEHIGDMGQLKQGDILITDMTDPDWEPVMKIAGAIVTNRGGRTCHAAIVARELGIPAIVGCGNATRAVEEGQTVTVSCAEGDIGYVYDGRLEYSCETIVLDTGQRPRTKIMLNLANPDQAFDHSFLPNDGVGLARLEFIINNSIRIHPRALLEYDRLDLHEKKQIDKQVTGYIDRRDFFVKRLAEGVGAIAAAFYPKPVIVRLSDFKSNEYASLIGGKHFEPAEENPMLGLRGASRYYYPDFRESFALECAALRMVRVEMGLDNMALMVPFVRTVSEGKKVLDLLAQNGLKRGEHGLKIYLMCELPANVLLAEQFLEDFDGFSIGSNDLTQLTLGTDRDSSLVSGIDERDPAVKILIEDAIHAAQRCNRYVGICGQAPSDFPEITEWLVGLGIDSLSLNPDSVLPMTKIVLQAEGRAKTS